MTKGELIELLTKELAGLPDSTPIDVRSNSETHDLDGTYELAINDESVWLRGAPKYYQQ